MAARAGSKKRQASPLVPRPRRLAGITSPIPSAATMPVERDAVDVVRVSARAVRDRGRRAGELAAPEVARRQTGPALEGAREVGRIGVSERACDVADLACRIAQHLAGDLEAHLLDHPRIGEARALQPALQRAGAGAHRAGHAMHPRRAVDEHRGHDLPHATVEVAGLGAACRQQWASHVIASDRGILHPPEPGVLPLCAPVGGDSALASNGKTRRGEAAINLPGRRTPREDAMKRAAT